MNDIRTFVRFEVWVYNSPGKIKKMKNMKRNNKKKIYNSSINSLQGDIDSLITAKIKKKIHQWLSRKRIDKLISNKMAIKRKLELLNNFTRGEQNEK